MKIHEIKTDPEPFEWVELGMKTHEIRYNDRDYQVGDMLILRKTLHTGEAMKNGAPLIYTDDVLKCMVTHIQEGYGLLPGWVILSFERQLGSLSYHGITGEMVEAGCAAVMAAHVYCDDPEQLVRDVFAIMRDTEGTWIAHPLTQEPLSKAKAKCLITQLSGKTGSCPLCDQRAELEQTHVLVPRAPTEAMAYAGATKAMTVDWISEDADVNALKIYRAMIEAAQKGDV